MIQILTHQELAINWHIFHTKYSAYKLRYNMEDFSSSTIVFLLMYKNGYDCPFKGSKFPCSELCGGGKPHIEAGFLNNYILHNAYNLLISECWYFSFWTPPLRIHTVQYTVCSTFRKNCIFAKISLLFANKIELVNLRRAYFHYYFQNVT
jgi:hypothetical protein